MTLAKSLFAIASLVWISAAIADAPYIDPANDEANFGDINNVLFWSTPQKVSGFRNMRKLDFTREVYAAKDPYDLPYKLVDLSDFSFSFEGAEISLDEYVRTHNVAGLVIVKDGSIVYERYELGNTAETIWISWSVTKSVTSLLVGAAIQDGYIKSVDEKVSDYLPRLKNSSYDDVTIRNLMQMSSGVEWSEDYADPESDINTISWDTLSIYDQLRDKPRFAEAGTVFNYNTAETNLVGTLLRSAIGNNLSTYLTQKIWIPFGMEHNAVWTLSEAGGGEFGGSNLSASLRDYARIGLFVLDDGRLGDGTRVLTENWIEDSTQPSSGAKFYGYLWWLRAESTFAASGIFGQAIHIDPEANIVIAQHSAREAASEPSDWAKQLTFFRAVTNRLER